MNIKILPITEPSKTEDNKEKHLIRGVFATNDFNPGDVIFMETPIVSALEPSLEVNYENCFHSSFLPFKTLFSHDLMSQFYYRALNSVVTASPNAPTQSLILTIFLAPCIVPYHVVLKPLTNTLTFSFPQVTRLPQLHMISRQVTMPRPPLHSHTKPRHA